MLPDPFPVARLRFECMVEREIEWPDYEGSSLRGIWGYALRAAACSTGAPDCGGCPLRRSCGYAVIFEPLPAAGQRATHVDVAGPYVIEPLPQRARRLARGACYAFDLVLIGPALAEVPRIVRAWQRALSGDIGPRRGAARLERVRCIDPAAEAVLFDADGGPGVARLANPGRNASAFGPAPESARLQLLTPLRLKRAGRVLGPDELVAGDLLFAAVRRVAEVCEHHLGRPAGSDFTALRQAAAASRFTHRALDWRGGSRWSTRQRQHVPLDGVVGEVTLAGPLRPFWPLLQLGQWLHLGGKTTFGLGRYRLDTPETEPT